MYRYKIWIAAYKENKMTASKLFSKQMVETISFDDKNNCCDVRQSGMLLDAWEAEADQNGWFKRDWQ